MSVSTPAIYCQSHSKVIVLSYLISIVRVVTAGIVVCIGICKAVGSIASRWHTRGRSGGGGGGGRRNISAERRHSVQSDSGDTMPPSWFRHVSSLGPLLDGGLVPEHSR